MRQRWTINGRFLAQPMTGVQRYARQIVTTLDRLVGEGGEFADAVELDLAVPRGAGSLDLQHIPVRTIGRLTGHAWEQVELPTCVRGGLLSLGNTGPIAIANQIVCIHDLNPRICPESYSRSFRGLYRIMQPLIGRRVRAITTVSKFSAHQIATFGIAPAERISVIPNGHEHVHAWRPRMSRAVAEASGADTIVLLGSAAPHKNVGAILGMADRLVRDGFRIAVVGQSNPGIFAQQMPHVAGPGIAWLGRLEDAELAALLQRSLCLAFPSLTEGFGLPPLEAMALGCPVVVSDRASLPEICGDAALYADPTRMRRWHAQFRLLRRHPTLRTALVDRGLAQARCFSWQRSAELYLRMLARPSGARGPSVPAAAGSFPSTPAVR
ncbi:glycosyltransferase family 4 protein [Methylobacterium sp. M6A4_1b]